MCLPVPVVPVVIPVVPVVIPVVPVVAPAVEPVEPPPAWANTVVAPSSRQRPTAQMKVLRIFSPPPCCLTKPGDRFSAHVAPALPMPARARPGRAPPSGGSRAGSASVLGQPDGAGVPLRRPSSRWRGSGSGRKMYPRRGWIDPQLAHLAVTPRAQQRRHLVASPQLQEGIGPVLIEQVGVVPLHVARHEVVVVVGGQLVRGLALGDLAVSVAPA